MSIVRINNLSHPENPTILADYCDSFWSRFRGLMFRRAITENEGILLVEKADRRLDTAIHMLFMNFDIAAIWIDSKNFIVDVKLARKWRPAYVPRSPARYILEAHPCQLLRFSIGDRVEMSNA